MHGASVNGSLANRRGYVSLVVSLVYLDRESPTCAASVNDSSRTDAVKRGSFA